MVLAFGVSALVAIALMSDMVLPRLRQSWESYRARRRLVPDLLYPDPGRERRAE